MPELAEHQVDAVAQCLRILRRYGGVLLADEPGLGKSFVAAAIARHLEGDGFGIEVLVPASLIRQWNDTLERFDVEGSVRSHDSLLHDRFVPWPGRRLLIVDEAHAFRNALTRRYDALARRSVGAHVLLLTATPLCNRASDLLSLLSLIATDDALLLDGVASIARAFHTADAGNVERCLSLLMIRRGHDILPPLLRFGRLQRQVIRHPVTALESLKELRFPMLADGVSRELLRRLMIRRQESSGAALAETIGRQRRFYERSLDAIASGRELTRRDYRLLFSADDRQEAMQQVLFWDLFVPHAATTRPEELEREIATLDAAVIELGRSPEAKLALLLDRLATSDVPALVFTEAVATAQSLFDALRSHRSTGLATSRRSWPRGAIDAFRAGRIDVLVATDLVSEGLDLQRAGVVVHYDLPWNPVRLDQRNGRAFRIGQSRPTVTGVYFMPERSPAGSGVLPVIAAKNRLRRAMFRTATEKDDPPDDAVLLQRRLALPPHLANDSSELRLSSALRRAGLPVPAGLLRPHRAGLQRLLDEMAREPLDRMRLETLEALLCAEPGQQR